MTELVVTEAMITKAYPSAKTDVVKYINQYKDKYGITTRKRMAAFIATCLVESWGFRKYVESMKYSASRLRQVFPKTVPTQALANRLAASGEKGIANYLYGKKNGNRGRDTDDGWNYRGQGAIQLTGLANFKAASESTGFDYVNNPSLLQTPEHAIISAMDWWNRNGCNVLADKIVLTKDNRSIAKATVNYSSSPTLATLRKRVNGATNHIQDVGLFMDALLKQM